MWDFFCMYSDGRATINQGKKEHSSGNKKHYVIFFKELTVTQYGGVKVVWFETKMDVKACHVSYPMFTLW